MDLTAIVLVPLLAQLKPLLAGVILAVFVQAAKKADSVTVLPEGNAKRVKLVANGLSFAAAVLVAYADGNLSSLDWTSASNLLADFAVVALSSAGTWALALKGRTGK